MKRNIIIVLMLLSIFTRAIEARYISIEQKITGLYVGYFNRAGDKEGLDFWTDKANSSTNSSDTLKELSAQFAKHPLFVSTYSHLNNRAFVEKIYQNSLGKDGDSEGINFWTKGLNNGMKRSDMVSSFIEASLEGDLEELSLTSQELKIAQDRQDLITNKVNVALKFTTLLTYHTNVKDINSPQTDPAYLASIKIISDVNEDISTLNRNISFLESIVDENNPIDKINNRGKEDEINNDEHKIPPISDSDIVAYLDAINQARSKNQDCGSYGYFPAVNPLIWSDTLYKASYEHIQDLVETETFSHTGSGTKSDWTGTKLGKASSVKERIENYNYKWSAIGENIAAGTFTNTAQKVVQQWLDSDGHCANLMSDFFTEVGMAMK